MPMKLDGMAELQRQIKQMDKKISDSTTEKALQQSAGLLKEKIETTAPYRKGTLSESIIMSDVKDGQINVGPDQQGKAFYGHFLEFGTSKMPAQPFMGPVYENNKTKVQEIMTDVIKKELGI